jgi:hypothetical protein
VTRSAREDCLGWAAMFAALTRRSTRMGRLSILTPFSEYSDSKLLTENCVARSP